MPTVFDVAKYILRALGRTSTWKLQKLCYYAQAWSLAWDEVPLFDEEFEAWANGPVCPELFYEHRGAYMIGFDGLRKGNPDVFSATQIETLDAVLEHYGDKDPYWLREQTHSEAPWKEARGDLPEGEPSNAVISQDVMGMYYGGF